MPILKHHGIVVPIPDVVPPDCGGPAFCAVCNAEMIEVEMRAMGIAFGEARRHALARGDVLAPEYLEEMWQRRSFQRAVYRRWAVKHFVWLAAQAAIRRSTPRGPRGGPRLSSDYEQADALGLTLLQYRKRQHRERAAAMGISARALARKLRDDRRNKALTSARIE